VSNDPDHSSGGGPGVNGVNGNGGGVADAFDRLYARWSAVVYRYAVHLVGPGPPADDLFQETWMKAIEHQSQLRDPHRFRPWIMRIARNLAFNQARGSRRRGQVWILSNLGIGDDASPGSDPVSQCPDVAPDPREVAIDAERRRILQDLLAGLEPKVQEMLQLRYFESLTLAEVAEILGIPLGTVCTKTYRALRTIRDRMQRRGYPGLKAI
jgi:RNA polymerase sigma-70 factor (ECF subfamily)